MATLENMSVRRRVLVVMVLCLTLLGAVLIVQNRSAAAGPATTGVGAVQDDMTGKAVGEALGLQPHTEPVVTGCDAFYAEYQGGAGHCLEGVTEDRVEQDVLALQITGYRATPIMRAFAAAEVAYLDDDHGSYSAEHVELIQNMRDLREQLDAEQPEA